MAFLHQARDVGVVNIEMEGLVFAAFCNKAGIRAAMVCTTLLVGALVGTPCSL